ncbi:dihydroceramide fatty acyl 2-hydroxylase FAH1-like isoform X1 [Primulina tabacum]|uniref:dihydroceramide fatty acyl 2-hydroxylase FAH1-like isoform X1 n=1 Tax=Primulina tabacum TaxID=48773 RepID=UPI003F59F9B7
MVVQGFTVDLDKPLVFQVGHLGEAYQDWVHQPIVGKEPRFFENDILEFLTKNDWWVIPLIWLPVVGWSLSIAVSMGNSIYQLFPMVAFGIFAWTLLEYTLHRFLFHIKTKSYWGNTLHYLLHGCHHKHPMDGLRLVFPPAATAILLVPFWNLIKLLSTPSTAPAFFGGGLLGYVMYDVTHYYLHHGQPTTKVSKDLKKYHLNHHFRIQNKGFGITSSVWDKIFGTLPPSKQAQKIVKKFPGSTGLPFCQCFEVPREILVDSEKDTTGRTRTSLIFQAIMILKLANHPSLIAQNNSSPIVTRSRILTFTSMKYASMMLSAARPYFLSIVPNSPPLKWPSMPTVGHIPEGNRRRSPFLAVL